MAAPLAGFVALPFSRFRAETSASDEAELGVAATQQRPGHFVTSIKDFGAVGDGRSHPLSSAFGTLTAARGVFPDAVSLDDEIDWAATQRAINSLPRGGIVYAPTGTYRMNRTVTIRKDGVTLQGDGGHTAGGVSDKASSFDFSGIVSGSDAIAVLGPNPRNTMKMIKFRGFYLEMGGRGVGGAGIKCFNCSGVSVEDLAVYVTRGPRSYGIQFSDLRSGSNAVIASSIRGCTAVCQGTPILIGAGSTSVAIDHSYTLGQGVGGVVFKGATYCAVTAAASDTGGATAYGYVIDGSTGIVLSGCGAENNGKGFLLITGGSTGITLVSCRGVGNNTSADTRIGSFLEINTAANYDIQVIGCTDTAPNPRTSRSIRGGAGTLHTTIVGYNATAYPKGIGGDVTWLASFLTIVAGGSITTASVRMSPGGQLIVPRMAASALPAWTPAMVGYVAWDSTNDRLVAYGTARRHYFVPSGTF
jgi:hypothetical protein